MRNTRQSVPYVNRAACQDSGTEPAPVDASKLGVPKSHVETLGVTLLGPQRRQRARGAEIIAAHLDASNRKHLSEQTVKSNVAVDDKVAPHLNWSERLGKKLIGGFNIRQCYQRYIGALKRLALAPGVQEAKRVSPGAPEPPIAHETAIADGLHGFKFCHGGGPGWANKYAHQAGHVLTLMLFLVLGNRAMGATIVADSCSLAHVSNAVFAASSGDTVQIPAGTCDWSEFLYITNKAIRLTGAGVGQTIIRDTGAAVWPWIKIWLQAGLTTEIDNIEFSYVNGFPADRIWIEGMNTDNRNLNWHHCRFTNFTSPTVFLTDTVTGVIHHNYFWNCGLIAHVKASYYDGTFGARDYGNQSMFAADYFGTTNFLFFEDNFVTNATSAIDAQAGGRYVWRFNTNYNFSPQTHGSEAAERSGRAFEVYGNRFYGNGSLGNAAFYRGGVTLLFSNYYENWPVGTAFNLVDNRILEHLFPPYGGASGLNPWDTNIASAFDSGTVSNTGTLNNTITDFSKAWTPNQYSHYQLVRTSGKAVTSLTRSGSTATANVVGHGFTNNAWVSFWGADQYGWNRIFQPITVTDANNFTFTTDYPVTSPATGTILCSIGNNFARILSNTETNITFAESLYHSTSPASLRLTNGDTYEIRFVVSAMDQAGTYGGTNFGTAAMPDVFNNLAHFQTVSANYQWSNTFADTVIEWETGFSGGGDYAHIIAGKHYTNNVPKPGYAPFPHPHYLATGGPAPGGGSSGTPAKTGQGRTKNKGPRGRFFQP